MQPFRLACLRLTEPFTISPFLSVSLRQHDGGDDSHGERRLRSTLLQAQRPRHLAPNRRRADPQRAERRHLVSLLLQGHHGLQRTPRRRHRHDEQSLKVRQIGVDHDQVEKQRCGSATSRSGRRSLLSTVKVQSKRFVGNEARQ